MIAVALAEPDDFEGWRTEARRLVATGIAPDAIVWSDTGSTTSDLFATELAPRPALDQAALDRAALDQAASGPTGREVRANRAFLDVARSVILHSDPRRLPLLYRVLWRLQDQPRLMDDAADADVMALERFARQVRRDIHKMRAFVRFRAIAEPDGGERYVAWFEPEHRIERANADFFVNRFTNQKWTILTPRMSLLWDGMALCEGPAAGREDAPQEDATEDLWLQYYRSIFNPARLKVGAMLKEMPRKYWKNLPEARQIAELVAGAQKREASMIATGANLFEVAPAAASLEEVGAGIAACRRCTIGCNGTRAVMGAGPAQARLMIVGEQPGDNEEREGQPFIGPAGQLLDRHLIAAGVDRDNAYVTNAVKHFKFAPRGKRRLHQSPTAGEIDTCRWWLDRERALVRPRVILALGASSGRSLLGRTPAIGRERGQAISQPDGTRVFLTAHPSYLLRLDGEARERETRRFDDDLAALAQVLG